MHHLDEVAGAVGPAVQISLLGGTGDGLAPRSTGNVAFTRREAREDGVEVLHHLRLAADHLAVAALASPDAAAGSDVDVVDSPLAEVLRAPDVVDVVGVPAVDEDVAGREVRHEVGDGRVDGCRRDHEPDGPRRLQLLHHVGD